VNGWTVAAFLVGWVLGTWMSWRKILQERRLAGHVRVKMAEQFGKRLFDLLQDVDVVNITVTEEGEKEISVDQEKLDQLLGKNPTEH